MRPWLQRSPGLRRVVSAIRTARDRLAPPPKTVSFEEMPAEQAFRSAFNIVLRREPDANEWRDNLPLLQHRLLPRDELVQRLHGSVGFRFGVPFTAPALPQSLHISRCEFIVGLPSARVILDIGGGDVTHTEGALLAMGYPYHFESLTIVDLPGDERHPLYRSPEHSIVRSRLGPVTYRYHSMSDLSSYAEESFDLVYSGQSIEHVPERDADHVIREIRRLLRGSSNTRSSTPITTWSTPPPSSTRSSGRRVSMWSSAKA